MRENISNKQKRIKRVRLKLLRSEKRPRLTVFRSNQYLYAQIINDKKGETLVSINSIKTKKEGKKNVELAALLGKHLAEMALKKNIKTVIFDRGGYKYHGKIKALAEGAREGGLAF